MSSMAPENLCKWRFTWETVVHIPTLRLFLFNPNIKPANKCRNLNASLISEESSLLVGWIEDSVQPHDAPVDFSLRVPVPRVLVDHGSPVDFRLMEDHIEVKLVLLLPVDHPILSNFDSEFDLSENMCSDRFTPLSMDTVEPFEILDCDIFCSVNVSWPSIMVKFRNLSHVATWFPRMKNLDLKSLSSREGVQFYCKSCSTKLTKRPLRSFVEMPSVNWREAADNWFGACCCSFGGISEKLVTKYANSYICAEGTCLLDATSVIVCKDDLVGCIFPDCDVISKLDSEPDLVGEDDLTEVMPDSGSNDTRAICCQNQSGRMFDIYENLSCMPQKKEIFAANLDCEVPKKEIEVDPLFCTSPAVSGFSGDVAPAYGLSAKDHSHCYDDMGSYVLNHDYEGCSHGVFETSSKDQESTKCIDLLTNQKSLLNGSLGNAFMVRTSNLSKDVKWIEFMCAQCSSPLGAYPCISDGYAPLDGGVRLFKCYISTDLPVGGSGDIFRKHTLQKMFTNKLLESANDELSFRTVVRDLRTRSPMLQIVLLNPHAWCCTGYCFGTEATTGPVSKINLHPIAKMLFSDCSNSTEANLRMIEEWVTKNQADEVYMLTHQIKELIESMKSSQDILPISYSFLQGLPLSSLER
ncbi:hypothetical protein HHK36_008561 [Tetracentron sinense]|uniref:Ubiquitin-conjugating enzyme E2C-binding protein n=1 Tax=Tetracentron sinense TaxID=13715 RepID=A0A835DJF6_TETSI|nr:hypothetical protein HHK36_008561 [Tetracentron sinense]